ncbi:hypothetical protein EVG20_g8200 [Dentipellis fragilis]|uniref:Uncharacterized protein n=1 Tax=Dentipellis fragilis TaxID=205917 RepID=A0A4Y9YA26_9AGAM|nr:hypothetical protein EVG20_g8200 [Dentipellis fragilis]
MYLTEQMSAAAPSSNLPPFVSEGVVTTSYSIDIDAPRESRHAIPDLSVTIAQFCLETRLPVYPGSAFGRFCWTTQHTANGTPSCGCLVIYLPRRKAEAVDRRQVAPRPFSMLPNGLSPTRQSQKDSGSKWGPSTFPPPWMTRPAPRRPRRVSRCVGV